MFIWIISRSPIIAGRLSTMPAANASIAGNRTRPSLSASALRWLWFVVLILFLPRCVQADIYSEIPDNSWIHVGPGTQAGQAAGREPPFGIVAFSGIAIDESQDQLLFLMAATMTIGETKSGLGTLRRAYGLRRMSRVRCAVSIWLNVVPVWQR